MSLPLPYYRDASQLPGPLPDQNEIEQAAQTVPNLRISDYGGRLIVIRDKCVVKYGSPVDENEGHALIFVEKQLDIVAPRLYAMYRHQKTLYIIMEYIPSISLRTAWPSLTEANKHSIV
ncbi:phosphotransferase enzyme family protein [Penicillium malachiteum]|nr:phosphotransferase enzyme family protein [Penicillium malachiteum]